MEMELDLKRIFSMLLNKLKYIVIIAVIAGFGAFIYNKSFVTPIYTSTAKFLVVMDDTSSKSSEANFVNQAVFSYLEIFNTDNFFREVAEVFNEKNDSAYTSSQIRSMVSIQSSSSEDTPSFSFRVSSTNPQFSYELANLISAHMKTTAEEYKVLNEISLIDDPQIPVSPSSPNVIKNTLLACFIGGILVAALFIVVMMLDRKIKDLTDITSRYDVPILGVVPDSNPASIKSHNKASKEER